MKRIDKPIKFPAYSGNRIKERGIDKKQVVRAVKRPDREWPENRRGKHRRRLQKRLSPKKLLVVIIDDKATVIEVVTAWFKR